MANIIIAWEFGSGLGHISHLAPFIDTLIKRKHNVTLVTKDLNPLSYFEFSEKLKVLPCPSIYSYEAKVDSISSIASILLGRGYGEVKHLSVMLKCWDSIFSLVQPDIVMIDYAPTALIAARMNNIKRIVIGSGFAEMEQNRPCRNLVEWVSYSAKHTFEHERKVVEVINSCIGCSGNKIKYLGDLYCADLFLMTTLPELDHGQRDCSKTLYIRPTDKITFSFSANWYENGKAKIFVYLKANVRGVKQVITALRGGSFDVICYCAGLPEKMRKQLNNESFQVLAKPVDLSKLLPTADLIISHASKEMVGETLLVGVPQLVLPSQLEQMGTSHLIVKLGVGLKVSGIVSQNEILDVLQKLINDRKYRKAAERISAAYIDKKQLCDANKAVYEIERLLSKSS